VIFEGMDFSDSGSNPPDPNGDISPEYYVQTVNATEIKVWDKQGNVIGGPFAANTIWAPLGFFSNGDPIILYDQGADRWFITEFPSSSRVLIGVSETSDPMGSWAVYTFNTDGFPDYPKYGIWPNAYMLTTNEFGQPGGLACYAIDRNAILNGEENPKIQRFTVPQVGFGFEVATPVDWDGTSEPPENSPAIIMRINDDSRGQVSEDRLDLWEISIDWNEPEAIEIEPLSLVTEPFDSDFCIGPGFLDCVIQPSGIKLDGIPWVIMHRAQYRNMGSHEAIVLNFTVDATGDDLAGIRWMELRKTPGDEWSVYQEGTVAPPDTLGRFMGGIAIDIKGNIGLAYSISGENKFPSLGFTGRRAGDPLGQMTVQEYEFASGLSSLGNSRYGDYASMSVDPLDGRTFWYTGEYLSTSGNWSTKVVAYNMGRDTVDVSPFSLNKPASSGFLGSNEIVEVSFQNQGIDPLTEFTIGYSFNGLPPVVEMAEIDTLFSDSIYTHTFDSSVDLNELGKYSFTIFTSLEGDQNPLNDSINVSVYKFPRWDLSLPSIVGLDNTVCDSLVNLQFRIANIGVDTITSAQLIWSLNNGPDQQIDWVGSLPSGASTLIDLQINDILSGDYSIQAIIINPNGVNDQIALNDSIEQSFSVFSEGTPIFLELKTDNYPEETTWELEDLSGNVLYSGGPYAESQEIIIEDWCLDKDSCYQFTIFDAFGDGIQAYGISGSYSIVDSEGRELASIMNINFGSEETNSFCSQFTCNLSASANISHESNPGEQNGTILLNQISGTGPYQFSLDNGQTFFGSPLINNLAPGDYILLIVDANECTFEIEITILECNIELIVTSTPESDVNAQDGSISVDASGGNGALEYSIDGGATFIEDSIFQNLGMGIYDIVVRDTNDCSVSTQVELDQTTSVGEVTFGYSVRIYPNPTTGLMQLEVKGLDDLYELGIQLYDASGQTIYHSEVSRYDDVLTGAISLLAYPSGVYYLRLKDERTGGLYRIIKH
jgi:hypothetical protein